VNLIAFDLGTTRLEARYCAARPPHLAIRSYPGYLAVLSGFATDMGGKHIWSRPTFAVNLPRWPGMLFSKRCSTWVITDAEKPQQALLGATLRSCDGVATQELARRNLSGFRAVWSIGAQQVIADRGKQDLLEALEER
jgi:hypothetical protein